MEIQSEGLKLSSPQTYLWRMILFLIISIFIAVILYPQVHSAFLSNPGLNGLIVGVLVVGVAYSFRQVLRLFPEVNWVNDFRIADPGIEVARPPKLLAPMATMLRDRIGQMIISASTMRSLLDSIAMRLDEARDISRYLIGLLVFLGLLGTFWGLLETVSSVGATINSLDTNVGDSSVIFEELKSGLQAPLSGMGTAFSSSLFGLAGSLVLGFLDLQATQAQNRFYNNLEDWLSTVTDISPAELSGEKFASDTSSIEAMQRSLEHLTQVIAQGAAANKGVSNEASSNATAAMASLAEGVQALVQHMQFEQQLIREWVEAQSDQREDLKANLDALTKIVANQKE
ncbi:MAG: hypothetical protein K8F25_15330 [Fimbriimonadaceae bacterium]|nr:hypothetical protein [Alphaproteobacteria bacterium]